LKGRNPAPTTHAHAEAGRNTRSAVGEGEDTMTGPDKSDWNLFQTRLPQWRERFMGRLCDEYSAILSGPYRGSDAFWEVKRLIRKDMKRLEVMVDVEKKEMANILSDLLREQVITSADLRDFSEEFQETVDNLVGK